MQFVYETVSDTLHTLGGTVLTARDSGAMRCSLRRSLHCRRFRSLRSLRRRLR